MGTLGKLEKTAVKLEVAVIGFRVVFDGFENSLFFFGIFVEFPFIEILGNFPIQLVIVEAIHPILDLPKP